MDGEGPGRVDAIQNVIKYLRETGFPNLDAAMKFWEACHPKGMSHDEVAALE